MVSLRDDRCCKSTRHPAEITYKGKSWCMTCFDKETEKDFKKQPGIKTEKALMPPEYIECECGGIKVRGQCPICKGEGLNVN